MDAPVSAPSAVVDDTPSTPDTEAEHLRSLIEKQPCCLMRVGLDGLVLAANDAAQQLLGGREPRQVLNHPLTEWIIPEHHAQWHEFAARIRDSGSGSAECDLVVLEGAHCPVLLQGVRLADHRDGIESVLLVARDVSASRRLEAALQEHASARQTLAEEHQLALLYKEREARQQLKALADQRVELQGLEENARRLEPLASAGRLALDVGRELQRKVAAVDAGARALLARCEQASPDRQQVEALLADAVGAASLARQFIQGSPASAEDPTPCEVVAGAVDCSCDSGRMS